MDAEEVRSGSDTVATYRRNLKARWEQERAAREGERLRLLEQMRETVPDVAASFDSIVAVYLHGSLLRPGAFTAHSDIDVAVEGATAEGYFAFWEALEEALPDRPVDLRDLEATPTFARRVRERGILVYARTD